MRKTSIVTLLLASLTFLPSCQGGAMPTSFDGIVKAASALGGDLSGFLGNLNLNDTASLNESTLGGLGSLLGQAKGLMGAWDGLPAEAKNSAMSMVGFDSFKESLGSIADFDFQSLLGASGGEKKSMLDGLIGNVGSLDEATKSLMGAMGM